MLQVAQQSLLHHAAPVLQPCNTAAPVLPHLQASCAPWQQCLLILHHAMSLLQPCPAAVPVVLCAPGTTGCCCLQASVHLAGCQQCCVKVLQAAAASAHNKSRVALRQLQLLSSLCCCLQTGAAAADTYDGRRVSPGTLHHLCGGALHGVSAACRAQALPQHAALHLPGQAQGAGAQETLMVHTCEGLAAAAQGRKDASDFTSKNAVPSVIQSCP